MYIMPFFNLLNGKKDNILYMFVTTYFSSGTWCLMGFISGSLDCASMSRRPVLKMILH